MAHIGWTCELFENRIPVGLIFVDAASDVPDVLRKWGDRLKKAGTYMRIEMEFGEAPQPDSTQEKQ